MNYEEEIAQYLSSSEKNEYRTRESVQLILTFDQVTVESTRVVVRPTFVQHNMAFNPPCIFDSTEYKYTLLVRLSNGQHMRARPSVGSFNNSSEFSLGEHPIWVSQWPDAPRVFAPIVSHLQSLWDDALASIDVEKLRQRASQHHKKQIRLATEFEAEKARIDADSPSQSAIGRESARRLSKFLSKLNPTVPTSASEFSQFFLFVRSNPKLVDAMLRFIEQRPATAQCIRPGDLPQVHSELVIACVQSS